MSKNDTTQTHTLAATVCTCMWLCVCAGGEVRWETKRGKSRQAVRSDSSYREDGRIALHANKLRVSRADGTPSHKVRSTSLVHVKLRVSRTGGHPETALKTAAVAGLGQTLILQIHHVLLCRFLHRKLSLSTNCIEKITNLNGLSECWLHTHTHTHSDHRWKRVVVMGCLVLPENLKILSLGRNNIKSFAGLVSHTGHWGVLGTWVRQIMHGHKLRRMMTELLPGLKFPSTLDLTNHEHPCKMFSFIFSYLCHKKNITTRNSVFIPTLLTWQHVDLKPTTQVQQIQDVCLWSGFT